MRLTICVAVVCGLLFLSSYCFAAKVKCKDGSCSVEKSTAKTATVAKSVAKTAVVETTTKRAKRHGKLHLHLPRLFKKGCKSC